MKFLPLLPIPGRPVRDALRDEIIDALRSRSRRRLLAEWTAGLLNHRQEKEPYLRRRKWAMAQIHGKAELHAMLEEFLTALGPLAAPRERDPISGGDITYHQAGVMEAIGGINYVSSGGGGLVSLSAEDIDRGDYIGEADFSSEASAQSFADALDRAGLANAGPYQDADGKWHVNFVLPESD